VCATRLVTLDDVPALTRLLQDSREFLTPWEPQRADDFFTDEVQRGLIRDALDQYGRGATVPHVILDDDRVVGRITLNTIVRGPFQSCSLGYWVGREHNGRGLASRAVAAIKEVAFAELGLHRIEASVLLHNLASQRVLDRNGFERFGVAPSYLKIAGRWQDMAIYQVLAPAEG
jgi:ribosomal-protein-alanine N-acetyltransferase